MKKKTYVLARNYPNLGKRLYQLRIAAGLTQREVGNALEYSSAQFISNFERGIAPPPADKLVKIFKLYKLSPQVQREVVDLMHEEDRLLSEKKLGLKLPPSGGDRSEFLRGIVVACVHLCNISSQGDQDARDVLAEAGIGKRDLVRAGIDVDDIKRIFPGH